ncbi:glycosyltransferase involved in cell wall biosynthesis [Salinibacter ruber]|uniref:glycosyltransferase family 4 protein n=1 Tax=Salinibacter ruber TaxID=146919 RepID=UPI0021685C00|nr:glycosyltransferase family 4 protein [Salinibacter ruber]MCS3700183.1 glycosyltransferase involved in cell wall biosynthesis [Salinibacter ruber]
MARRLAIVTSHPIQYYAPLFRRLAGRDALDIHVFYGWKGATKSAYDPGFEDDVEWDISLLDGYDYTFVPNTSSDPGSHHFRGLVNPDLIPEIDSWGPDALLLFGWAYQSHLRALLRFSGDVPIFFRGDSTLLDEQGGLRTALRRLFLRWVYRHVDVALYVGQNNRAYFEAHGLSDQQLAWTPHAVENQRFKDAPVAEREAQQWRRELGIPDEAVVLLFAGKFEPKKAPDTLLDAFLEYENEKAHLALAGSGPMEDKLRRRAEENARVHFLGFQNQSRMPVVYRLGDVFVLPSRGPGETWGLAVNEAMACGRPVVVSERVGCAPDLVEQETGFVVPAEDAGALRQRLDTLVDDDELRRQMGRTAQTRIEDWSIRRAARRIEQTVGDHVSRLSPDGQNGAGKTAGK